MVNYKDKADSPFCLCSANHQTVLYKNCQKNVTNKQYWNHKNWSWGWSTASVVFITYSSSCGHCIFCLKKWNFSKSVKLLPFCPAARFNMLHFVVCLIVIQTTWNCYIAVWYNCSGATTLHQSGITPSNLVAWEVRQTIGPMLVTVHSTLCLDASRSLILTRHRHRVSFMNMFVASLTLVNESLFCCCFTGKL